MNQSKLPEDLRHAYDWTDAAGELEHLCGLTAEGAAVYATESAENFRNSWRDWRDNATEHDVTEDQLLMLRDWLRATDS